ncbi:MAG: hypothetical protein ABR559_03980 [Gemmatimonadota bacterium]
MLIAALTEALRLAPGERLVRCYRFEGIERRDVTFTLALVTKRVAPDRLELVAVGSRVGGVTPAGWDFIRRARFPDAVLPRILAEFMDRCGVEGAAYGEHAFDDPDQEPDDQLASLAALLAPPARQA